MAKTTKKSSTEVLVNKTSSATRDSLADYIQEISSRTQLPEESMIHSVIAINQILSRQETVELLDEELKSQLRETWLKLKAFGIQLQDPPLLFGLPEDFMKEELAN